MTVEAHDMLDRSGNLADRHRHLAGRPGMAGASRPIEIIPGICPGESSLHGTAPGIRICRPGSGAACQQMVIATAERPQILRR
jgi:hypothetical protein